METFLDQDPSGSPNFPNVRDWHRRDMQLRRCQLIKGDTRGIAKEDYIQVTKFVWLNWLRYLWKMDE